MKSKLFTTIVASSFYYGCATWPKDAKFQRRVNSNYFQLLRYCLNMDNKNDAFLHGDIPHPSAFARFARLQIVGHTLRHQGAFAFLLITAPKHVGKALDKDLLQSLHFAPDRGDWTDLALDRKTWKRIALCSAEAEEERAYKILNQALKRRWLDQGRLEARVNLIIAEVLSDIPCVSKTTKSLTPMLQHHHLAPRRNRFAIALNERATIQA